MFLDGRAAWSHDQEQAFQDRAKLEHLRKELEKLCSVAAAADRVVAKLTSGNLGQNKGKLYPLLNAYGITSALRETGVRFSTKECSRRDDQAKLLHASGYQGGRDVEAQLAHHRQVAAARHERAAEKEGDIRALRGRMALKDLGAGAGTNTTRGGGTGLAGGKKNHQLVS